MKRPSKSSRKHPYSGRQSKIDREAWVHVMCMMISEITHSWPEQHQIEVLDGLLQAIVQRLNWLNEQKLKL